ncbi:Hypothetical_protein [Hexamita inflata]|uniref:Hypothetical_protein n=1 Tax=Hexamita inflata TaxID=28002 RepID=A0AA86U7W4_9EUKA|nr:Hypothetical protein HINF_LOCUS34185 [Hexamita inflata]
MLCMKAPSQRCKVRETVKLPEEGHRERHLASRVWEQDKKAKPKATLDPAGSEQPLIANSPLAIYSEIRNLQKQINQNGTQEPNQINEPMHQRQPSSSNANTTEQLSCKPKEITSKEKLRSENQFLKIKLANQVQSQPSSRVLVIQCKYRNYSSCVAKGVKSVDIKPCHSQMLHIQNQILFNILMRF